MIAPLGRLLILLSLFLAAAGAVVGLAVSRRYSATGWAWTRRLAYAYAGAISLANGLMIYALLAHDFSVGYVAQVGSRATPTWVTIASLWSSLDGSLLFWGLVLGAYVAAATHSRDGTIDDLPPLRRRGLLERLPPLERLAIDQLHGNALCSVPFLKPVDDRDVGVIQCGKELGFALEASESVCVRS